MMESSGMFPDGFHPDKVLLRPDLGGKARYFTRTQRPPKYYLIDFGMSRRYNADGVCICGDSSPTETQQTDEPRNPYWKDICDTASLVRREFIEVRPIRPRLSQFLFTAFLP